MAATTAGFFTTRHNIQSEFPLGNNYREPLVAQPVLFVTQTKKEGITSTLHLSSICRKRYHRTISGPAHSHVHSTSSGRRHLCSQQVAAASWLFRSDGLDMLTCCPKCQHVLTSPAGSAAAAAAAAAGTSCTVAGLQLSMQEAADDVPAAAASGTAITVRVPGWTTGGGSVVLQAVPQGTGGLKVSTGEPSPSAPLSFVLPTTPTVILAGPAGQQWSFLVTPSPPPPTQPSPPPPPSIFNPLNPAFTANPSRLQSDLDLRTLTATQTALRTSGWYYEGLSWQESANLLLPTTAGTFLVRDSSDPRYLFSLSVQTDRGPTSTRLHYADGRFRFDAEPKIIPHMPLFDCVVKLVQHYTQLTANKSSASTTTSSANITTSNNHVTNFVANLNSQNKNFVADASKPRRKRSSAPRDQVWIDSAGQVHSHILLTSPLRQKDRFPSLMHLSRLAVNRLKVSTHIPIGGALPLSLQQYLGDYPYLC